MMKPVQDGAPGDGPTSFAGHCRTNWNELTDTRSHAPGYCARGIAEAMVSSTSAMGTIVPRRSSLVRGGFPSDSAADARSSQDSDRVHMRLAAAQ
jgi:hypothetical protein